MTGMERWEKFNHKTSMGIEWIGVIALLSMMLITVVDVIAASIFTHPLSGALDMVSLAQLLCITCAVSSTLLLGGHIEVEFFALLLPKRVQLNISRIVYFLGFLLSMLIVWRLFMYGVDLQMNGEVSPTARFPLHPFAYVAAFACVPTCLVFLYSFIKSFVGVSEK